MTTRTARTARGFSRREALGGMFAAGATFALDGCCRCRVTHLPAPSVPADTLVIDPHCHIFNAHDLDIFNYISPTLSGVLGLTHPVLFTITEFLRAVAPPADIESALLDRLIADRSARMAVASRDARLARDDASRAAHDAFAQMEHETDDKRRELLTAPSPDATLAALEAEQNARSPMARAVRAHDSAARRAIVRDNAETARRKLLEPRIAAFVDGLWFPRSVNANRLARVYPAVSLFTPAMMDPDTWFQGRPWQPTLRSTPVRLQLEVHEKVAILTNGKFLPFLAFDPRRQVEASPGSDAPLDVLAMALEGGATVGLKLYPPMGYRPTGNAELDPYPPEGWPSGLGAAMDAVMARTFATCMEEELTVMAHANRSHASAPTFIDNGKPAFWERALDQHRHLRVNLGHFGGMDNTSTWRDDFCRLMTKFPHVYADTGDFEGITCAATRAAFFDGVQSCRVRERLMYGSDFYMNGIYEGYEQYQDDWLAAFQDEFPDDWRRLVGGNAADFLGLRGGKQRDRLEVFAKRNELSPRWMTLL